MTEANSSHGPQRRRSPRLASPQAPLLNHNKMALGAKRFINVRKIAPRKTAAPAEPNKENTPSRAEPNKNTPSRAEPNKNTPSRAEPNKNTPSRAEPNKENTPSRAEPNKNTPSRAEQQKKQKVSTPGPGPGRRPSSSSAGRKKKQPRADMPSPILPSTPPAADPEDAVWSQKVRRSYTRLSDRSVHRPEARDTLFGFERLQTPEVASNKTEQSGTALEASGSSFTSLLEAEESRPEPDPNIPGVAVLKQRRRRRKVPHINAEELDALAARMNAEFREAEEFDLVVE